VGDSVLVINEGLNADVVEKCGRAVLARLVGFVEHSENRDAALVGVYQGFGNRR
jgi:hypothetical protein